MQSKKLKNLITIFFVLFIFSSCTKDLIVTDPPVVIAPPSPNENKISFSGEIQPIFSAKCTMCHGTGQNSPTLVAGKSYQSLMSMQGMIDTVTPGNSILYKQMATGGGMSQYCNKANADSTYKWIRQGAKNN